MPAQDPSTPAGAGRAATLTGELTIVPDTEANSLLVRANRQDFELVQSVIHRSTFVPRKS